MSFQNFSTIEVCRSCLILFEKYLESSDYKRYFESVSYPKYKVDSRLHGNDNYYLRSDSKDNLFFDELAIPSVLEPGKFLVGSGEHGITFLEIWVHGSETECGTCLSIDTESHNCLTVVDIHEILIREHRSEILGDEFRIFGSDSIADFICHVTEYRIFQVQVRFRECVRFLELS